MYSACVAARAKPSGSRCTVNEDRKMLGSILKWASREEPADYCCHWQRHTVPYSFVVGFRVALQARASILPSYHRSPRSQCLLPLLLAPLAILSPLRNFCFECNRLFVMLGALQHDIRA